MDLLDKIINSFETKKELLFKIEGYINSLDMTKVEIYTYLGMSKATFFRKLNNPLSFTLEDIKKLKNLRK
jgi:hypothetical protein